MNIKYKLVILLIGLLSLSFSSQGQSCHISVSTTNLCVNHWGNFSTTCSLGQSNSWVVYRNNQVIYSEQGLGQNFTYQFLTAGNFVITYSYTQIECTNVWDPDSQSYVENCVDQGLTGSIEVTVAPSFPIPIITADASSICQVSTVALAVTNPQAGITYTWTSNTSAQSYVGTTANFTGVNSTTVFTVVGSNLQCSLSTGFEVQFIQTLAVPEQVTTTDYRKATLRANPTTVLQHYWQVSETGTSTSKNASLDYIVSEPGTYFIRAFKGGCWAAATGPIQPVINYQPPLPSIVKAPKAGYTEVFLTNNDPHFISLYADYYWVAGAGSEEIISEFSPNPLTIGSKFYQSGTYYLRGRDRATGTWGSALTVEITIENLDHLFNRISATTFNGKQDGFGGLEKSGETRSYFDTRGKILQSQVKNFSQGKILSSQQIIDSYERVVGQSLSAPLLSNEFRYNAGFFLDEQDNVFSEQSFASGTVSKRKGTIGNYYSEFSGQPGVPISEYPYSRNEYYEDGSGEMKLGGGVGFELRLGSGHEVWSKAFPVFNETNDYLQRRLTVISGAQQPLTLKGSALQTVSRDQNGKFAVALVDKEGKGVMSARFGSPTDNVLQISNTILYSNYDQGIETPFYITHTQDIQILMLGDFYECTIKNLITGNTQTFIYDHSTPTTIPPISLSPGFYAFNGGGEGAARITYTNYFTDVSYQFYDLAGRLVVSISPNGVKQLTTGAAWADIDKTTYQYNYRGWLLSMTEPDAGRTEYMYRSDGKIRFSQNALQREGNRFSYTHYDELGRPIESGEYKGTTEVFNSVGLKAKLELADQTIWTGNDIIDWVKTYYDEPHTPGALGDYNPTFVRGAVAASENVNIKTWYSYDELGRVKWMVQKPVALSRYFVVKYEYDFTGKVEKVEQFSSESDVEKDRFFHHYEYDADQRLSVAYTSLDGTTKKEQARYHYYLHGPLRRVELAQNLQGIDFIYNIQGWLTQINHPEVSMDPGGDGTNGFQEDVFGMVLSYYENEGAAMQTSGLRKPRHDLSRRHNLPSFVVAENGTQAFGSGNTDSPLIKHMAMDQFSAEQPIYQKLIQDYKSNNTNNH
jgi:hypothetical protein